MKKKYKISEMSWVEFDQRRKESKLAIIPTGAVEIYGPHLPMGADGIAAEAVALAVAERCNGLVAPLIPVANSSALLDFTGTISIKPETFSAIVDEIVTRLMGYGFTDFLFITGHADSVSLINYFARMHQINDGIRFAQIDWWRFTATVCGDIYEEQGYMAHGHASECGGSVMLYLCPELVDMSKATRVAPDPKYYSYPEVLRFTPLPLKSPNATVGDATKASAAKGEATIKRSVERILSFLKDEWGVAVSEA